MSCVRCHIPTSYTLHTSNNSSIILASRNLILFSTTPPRHQCPSIGSSSSVEISVRPILKLTDSISRDQVVACAILKIEPIVVVACWSKAGQPPQKHACNTSVNQPVHTLWAIHWAQFTDQVDGRVLMALSHVTLQSWVWITDGISHTRTGSVKEVVTIEIILFSLWSICGTLW